MTMQEKIKEWVREYEERKLLEPPCDSPPKELVKRAVEIDWDGLMLSAKENPNDDKLYV